MSDSYIGQMMQFGGNFAIRDWAYCQAQLLPIAQNTALFSILGTTFGGNGTTTFGLPDFRGRMAIGVGQGPGLPDYTLGEMSGTPTVTLITANLPPIPNLVPATSNSASASSPLGNIPAAAVNPSDGSTIDSYAAPNTANGFLNTSFPGQGVPFSTMSPYLAITWLICLYGIFPPRS